jgi:hypothetical protein
MKKRVIRSAYPVYLAAAAWVVLSLFLPMYELSSILLCAGTAIAAYLIGSRFFPGRTVEEEAAPDSGNAEVDCQIGEGRIALKALRTSASDIAARTAGDAAHLTVPIERMVQAGEKIFAELEKNPADSQQVRKFMNYYLPTAVKLLDTYRTMLGAGGGENITSTLSRIENSLGMIADAFEKQLDRLYADDQIDIYAEISALETMMAADGLKDAPTPMTKK